MKNLFAAFTVTLIVSLVSSIVRGQDYSEREEKLLHTPDQYQCNSDGFHADPNDCTIFYRCIDWGESSENSLQPRYTSFKFQCGEGTVFDIEANNCVHVEETTRMECRQYAEPYEFARISERDAGDGGQVDYGVEQRPSSGYNRPSQQPSYNRPSTEGQMPGDSGDVDNNIGEPSSQPPSKSPPCEADGFFPIQNDCTHFYRCVGNGNGFNKYEFSCGPGTVWDPDNNACNHRWAVSRTDCKAEETGSEGGPETSEGPETNEGPESPEIAAQVAEPSSTTSVPSTSTSTSTTTRPSYQTPSRPSQSTPKPTTTTVSQSTPKPTTTTTSQSTTSSASSTTQSSTTSVQPSEGANENGTKPGNSCQSEGFFADEKDCKKFYRCVDQGNGKYTKYEFECAEGTVWDVQETTCNYDYAVQQTNCNSSSSESQTSTTAGESSSSTSDSSSAGTSSTSSYTNSSSATTTSQQSSSATSTTSQQSSSATSTTSQQSSSATSTTSQQQASSSSQTTASSSQTTSSQQTSSSSSSTSSQSTSSSQQTTNNQQSTGSSSSQNNATSTATQSTGSSSNGSQSKDDKCTEEGFFPSSKNCNKFYRCVSNEGNGFTKYEFNCGPGTVWDPDNNVCNHPWAVRDEKCRSGTQGTTPMGESPSSESTPSSSSTESSAQTTARPSTNNTTTAASTSTTPSQTSTTGSNNATTVASNITDSTEAASTTASNQTISTTESATESNPTTTEAGCTNSTTTKPSGKIKCEKAGYYPNPDDCKKFYRCVDWDGDKGERFSVYHFNCPQGTIFDPSLNVCNHEESVYPPRNCDGSGSQTTDSTPTSSPAPDNTTTTEPSTTTETSTSNTTEVTETSNETTTMQITTETSTNGTDATTLSPSETTPVATTPVATTKPYESTTTASTSTSEKATETTNPSTSVATESTTPLTTPASQLTTTEISTTTSPSTETCPEIGPDQFRLVCPTGFRRHPKYCNLFYQCTVSKSMDIKIVTLSCTNGTIYDEKKIQCLPPEEATKCDGSMMMDARNLKNLDDNSVSPISVKSEKSICPNEGSFTYKDDCRLFYKCKKDDQAKLTGYLYQCPEGFAYWSVSKRCEKMEKVPCDNKKASSISSKSSLAPVETKNVGF